MSNNVKDALVYYKRCKTRCQFMEVVAMIPGKTMGYYRNMTGTTIGNTIMDKTNVAEINYDIQYLITLGYIVCEEKSDIVSITEKGLEALREGTLQNISMNAYKNYLDLNLRRLAVRISLVSLLTSLISLLISIQS